MEASEEDVRSKVLEAHQILMSMNEANEAAFHDLVAALEADDTAQQPRRAAV